MSLLISLFTGEETKMAIEINVWIYWLFCVIAMSLIIIYRTSWTQPLLSQPAATTQTTTQTATNKGKNYSIALSLGWLSTVIAAIGYILFIHKYENGNYEIPDVLMFSVSNGILEQFMFVFWLLIGCYLGKLFAPDHPRVIFGLGFTVYAVFSGLIHAFFWTTVLPPHEPVSVWMALVLTVMSFLWMWLFWRHQAILAIISMHIFVDFFMISHLHFTWFEPLQALLQNQHLG